MPHSLGISWQGRVVLVIAGFLSMILTYTGVYFYLAASGDYNQAVASNIDFKFLPAYPDVNWQQMTREDLLHKLQDRHEFKGMNHHLFLAIHEDSENTFGRERELLSAQEIFKLAQDEKQLKPRLDSNATRGLVGDCFHFSVTTASTVGYGDISPATSFTRFVADTQILASVAILVFGVGFVMNNRGDAQDISIKNHDVDELQK